MIKSHGNNKIFEATEYMKYQRLQVGVQASLE